MQLDDIAEFTVCRIIPIVGGKIVSFRLILMLNTSQEFEEKKQDLLRITGIPGIIGAIDRWDTCGNPREYLTMRRTKQLFPFLENSIMLLTFKSFVTPMPNIF